MGKSSSISKSTEFSFKRHSPEWVNSLRERLRHLFAECLERLKNIWMVSLYIPQNLKLQLHELTSLRRKTGACRRKLVYGINSVLEYSQRLLQCQ